jgi:ABC-2 type transport system ATP-binding protein
MELEIKNLIKTYNKQTVLNIDSLTIQKGELIGLIGNNGAGKTTLLRLLIDLLKADSGMILSRGKKINKTENWKFYTSAYIDTGFLIEFLTPEEYFYFIASNYNISNQEVKNILNQFTDFMNGEILEKHKYIRDFSTGNQQKIGIIGALITKPEILLLDEPFNFLDPSSQIIMKRLLQEYNRKYNTTILLSSHNLQYVMNICTRIIVLDSGKVRYNAIKPSDAVKREIENYFENK